MGLEAEPAVGLIEPELDERGRQQWEGSGLLAHLGNQRVDERRIDANARAPGGQLDRALHLVGRHRADEHLIRGHPARELRVGRTVAVEVAAQPDDDGRAIGIVGELGEPADEGCALLFVGADGEELLELVDHEHEAVAVSRSLERRGELP